MSLYVKAAVLGGALLHGSFAEAQATNNTGVTCPSTAKFNPITATKFFAELNPGWNLGNTLDAIEDEGDWGNPPVVDSTFRDVQNAGFKSIRLPVTWAYHLQSEAPDYTIDPAWLQRVEDVVNMVDNRGLYSIVNVHHDSWVWADLTKNVNVTMVEEKLYKLWYQIGKKLACKGERVAFETINELPGTTAAHGAETNRLNDIFLQAINDAGGHNPNRVVTLVSSGEDGLKTTQWFKPPNSKFKNPWGIQYHYYSPYDFIFAAWGKTTWGSAAEKALLESDIATVRGNFSGVPLVIGEWAASPVATETAARWRYFDFFVRTAAKYSTSTILWDNGADFLDRATHLWRDPVAIAIYQNAVKGIPNALPYSTTDAAATRQESSAYIYHKRNTTVTDVTLPFYFNGNTLRSISIAKQRTLVKGKEYTVTGENITFTSSFLNTIFTPTASYGSLTNLTLQFSRGADLIVNALLYNTPTTTSSTIALPATDVDLSIPIAWAGQNRPATVKAIKADGTFLQDDFTQYFGPMQAGRITYGSWDWNAKGVILRASVVAAVRKAAQDVTFTVEFYPREPGNEVAVTVKV